MRAAQSAVAAAVCMRESIAWRRPAFTPAAPSCVSLGPHERERQPPAAQRRSRPAWQAGSDTARRWTLANANAIGELLRDAPNTCRHRRARGRAPDTPRRAAADAFRQPPRAGLSASEFGSRAPASAAAIEDVGDDRLKKSATTASRPPLPDSELLPSPTTPARSSRSSASSARTCQLLRWLAKLAPWRFRRPRPSRRWNRWVFDAVPLVLLLSHLVGGGHRLLGRETSRRFSARPSTWSNW